MQVRHGTGESSWGYFSSPLLSSSKTHKLKYTIPCFSHFFLSSHKHRLSKAVFQGSIDLILPNLFSSLETKSLFPVLLKKHLQSCSLLFISSPLSSSLLFYSFSLLKVLHQMMVFLGLSLYLSVERQKE